MEQHLPDLVPYLFNSMKDTKPLIRTITCWTLSRYATWIIHHPQKNVYFEPLIALLLQRILDDNKRVQESACRLFIFHYFIISLFHYFVFVFLFVIVIVVLLLRRKKKLLQFGVIARCVFCL